MSLSSFPAKNRGGSTIYAATSNRSAGWRSPPVLTTTFSPACFSRSPSVRSHPSPLLPHPHPEATMPFGFGKDSDEEKEKKQQEEKKKAALEEKRRRQARRRQQAGKKEDEDITDSDPEEEAKKPGERALLEGGARLARSAHDHVAHNGLRIEAESWFCFSFLPSSCSFRQVMGQQQLPLQVTLLSLRPLHLSSSLSLRTPPRRTQAWRQGGRRGRGRQGRRPRGEEAPSEGAP